jgi:hypothetical protein
VAPPGRLRRLGAMLVAPHRNAHPLSTVFVDADWIAAELC